jgi:hypothetical protein
VRRAAAPKSAHFVGLAREHFGEGPTPDPQGKTGLDAADAPARLGRRVIDPLQLELLPVETMGRHCERRFHRMTNLLRASLQAETTRLGSSRSMRSTRELIADTAAGSDPRKSLLLVMLTLGAPDIPARLETLSLAVMCPLDVGVKISGPFSPTK